MKACNSAYLIWEGANMKAKNLTKYYSSFLLICPFRLNCPWLGSAKGLLHSRGQYSVATSLIEHIQNKNRTKFLRLASSVRTNFNFLQNFLSGDCLWGHRSRETLSCFLWGRVRYLDGFGMDLVETFLYETFFYDYLILNDNFTRRCRNVLLFVLIDCLEIILTLFRSISSIISILVGKEKSMYISVNL